MKYFKLFWKKNVLLNGLFALLSILLLPSCASLGGDGWSPNFKYALDKERYKNKNSGKGWTDNFKNNLNRERFAHKSAGKGWSGNFNSSQGKNRFNGGDSWGVGFKSGLSKNRFNKSDSWGAHFKPHQNVERHCRTKGWSIDFRSSLNPKRFEGFNSNFFVMPATKYQSLSFNDSFSSSKKSNEGGFAYNKKKRAVKEKGKFRLRSKPHSSDSFGPNVEKKYYKENVYNKKKKKVTRRKRLFKKKKEKPYKRRDNMELDLFQFKP